MSYYPAFAVSWPWWIDLWLESRAELMAFLLGILAGQQTQRSRARRVSRREVITAPKLGRPP